MAGSSYRIIESESTFTAGGYRRDKRGHRFAGMLLFAVSWFTGLNEIVGDSDEENFQLPHFVHRNLFLQTKLIGVLQIGLFFEL